MQYTNFINPPMGSWALVTGDNYCKDSLDVSCPVECGCTKQDTGQNQCAYPDLDHTHPDVQRLVKEYLNYYKSDLGFTGIRWDQAKGFLPEYFLDYNNHASPVYAVGEYYDGFLGNNTKWLTATENKIPLYDFPLYFALRQSLNGNSFANLAGNARYYYLSDLAF